MNKTTKNILIGVGVLAGLYFWNKNKKPKDLRSQEEKDCVAKGRSWDSVEKFCGM
jgi:hypothetical protein